MSVRRVIAFLMFLAVSVSSVEVMIGGEPPLVDATAAQVAGDAADPEPSGDADDCECLCACLCAGAQLVVAPATVPPPAGIDGVDPPVAHVRRSATLPSPRPPHRPPLA